MSKKKAPATPAAPTHDCGHEIWMHSKRTQTEPWHCTACDCKTKLTPVAA